MVKGKDEFLEHFARLGVFSKVATLATEPESETNQSGEEQTVEDARELLVGRAYHWRDWCICRGRDCLYVWSDAAALELSNGSNGWFRFILDGKLATMYSSGSPEGGTDTTGELLLKITQLICEILLVLIYQYQLSISDIYLVHLLYAYLSITTSLYHLLIILEVRE